MKTFKSIQQDVGNWSKANFGDQESPYFTIKIDKDEFDAWNKGEPMPPSLVCLGSLAPLWGIVEEYGELQAAVTDDEKIDACGDIYIYCCDYASREGFVLPIGIRTIDQELPLMYDDAIRGMGVWIGKLYHATLKHHQGIRGFEDENFYKMKRDLAVAMLLAHLQAYCAEQLNERLLVIANKTWNGIVSKRNWKTSPTDGQN